MKAISGTGMVLGIMLVAWMALQPVPAAAAGGKDPKQAELFLEANASFSQANDILTTDPVQATELYKKALLRYEHLVEKGLRNGKLYYNIGNVYYRLGDIGRAIVNYRRAEQYSKTDPNLEQNLNFVLSQRADKIEEKQKDKMLKTLFFWHYDLSAAVRALVFAVFYSAFWIFLVLRLYRARPWIHWGLGITLTVFLLLTGSLVVDHYGQSRNKAGVLVAAETVARKGDGRTYQPSFAEPLHAGTEFSLLEERGKWRFVELQDGRRTWVEAGDTELVGQGAGG
jgi:tetratricopeptide (TPR) repeat protein